MRITRKVASATNTVNIPVAVDTLDDITDFSLDDEYLGQLYGEVEKRCGDKFSDMAWYNADSSIKCEAIPADSETVIEFTIPHEDLIKEIDHDAEYIANAFITDSKVESAISTDKESIMAAGEILREDMETVQELIITLDDFLSYAESVDMSSPRAQASVESYVNALKKLLDKLPQSIYFDSFADDDRFENDLDDIETAVDMGEIEPDVIYDIYTKDGDHYQGSPKTIEMDYIQVKDNLTSETVYIDRKDIDVIEKI